MAQIDTETRIRQFKDGSFRIGQITANGDEAVHIHSDPAGQCIEIKDESLRRCCEQSTVFATTPELTKHSYAPSTEWTSAEHRRSPIDTLNAHFKGALVFSITIVPLQPGRLGDAESHEGKFVFETDKGLFDVVCQNTRSSHRSIQTHMYYLYLNDAEKNETIGLICL